MGFLETVEQSGAFLDRNGRASLLTLQHEFDAEDLRDVVPACQESAPQVVDRYDGHPVIGERNA